MCAALFALSGCFGYKYNEVKGLQGKGSAFDQALFKEYQAESRSEFLQGNYESSDLWADRAMLAAKGTSPKPTQISDWQLPSGAVSDLTTARSRLQAALDKGGATAAPTEMAKAQVGFDCWAEQQRVQENFQPDDIAACKKKFNDNIAKVEAAIAPKPAAAAPAKPKDFLVFFDWDKYNLTPEALKIIADATAAAKQANAKSVKITGHTDTSGSAAYNLRLSERRAQAVAAQMIKLGIPATSIATVGRGQEDLLVPTPDNVREPQNRRASIAFPQAGASTDTKQFVHIDVTN
jgi:outer membrane protein OmpA-like peptidoglycan-associated protein